MRGITKKGGSGDPPFRKELAGGSDPGVIHSKNQSVFTTMVAVSVSEAFESAVALMIDV